MLDHLDIPSSLHRNGPDVAQAGYENTGQTLLDLVARRTGKALHDADVLDVGCGVRLVQTLINRRISFGSYTGIEVYKPIIDFLKGEVEEHDERFRFAWLNVHNAMYSSGSETSLVELERLPDANSYDLIWLFSVFTHLNPEDAAAMLRLLRQHIRPGGKLLFSAFIEPDFEGFQDRFPEDPLLQALFGQATMEALLEEAGWAVDGFWVRDRESCIMDYFVCSPMPTR